MIGRLTKDPYVSQNGENKVARFSLAINRGKDGDGNDRGADYPSIVCFGKTAELAEKYLTKGRQVGISGHLQTGSYEKDGRKIYTTDVIADRILFLGSSESESTAPKPVEPDKSDVTTAPDGFSPMGTEDDIPF